MKAMGNCQLVDVPTGSKVNCSDLFWKVLNRAPSYIRAELHSKGSHTGRGTSWAGEYSTYEIFDSRRSDWPTEEVEEWRNEIEFAIIEKIQQIKSLKVR